MGSSTSGAARSPLAASWLAVRVLANLGVLAVVVASWLAVSLLLVRERSAENAVGMILSATILYWGSMLVPTLVYLAALELWFRKRLHRRLYAIALSPICAIPLYVAALDGTHESLGLFHWEALSLPLAYGAVVRFGPEARAVTRTVA